MTTREQNLRRRYAELTEAVMTATQTGQYTLALNLQERRGVIRRELEDAYGIPPCEFAETERQLNAKVTGKMEDES
jgi:hypothetical protein